MTDKDLKDEERGERAGFDRRTGEVHGSGSGAGGGGNPREDYDADPMAGGGAEPVSAPVDRRGADAEPNVAGRARP